jgi:hypothetical protein
MNRKELTNERLRELFDYDPRTGQFLCLKQRGPMKKGAIAGYVNSDGYKAMMIDGRIYLAHRLAWFYVHGKWPVHMIDHINRVKTDNRIGNLRDVTNSQNLQNTKLKKSNSSGYKGVTFNKKSKKWCARITVNSKKIHLGYFYTREDAYAEYRFAAKQFHTHNSCLDELA